MNKIKQFLTVLEEKSIRSVFQPIVSLETGNIFGYEALTRINSPKASMNIEEFFEIANSEKKLWEFEKLCRNESLKNAASMPVDTKLFLNVDANLINDPELKSGFTIEKLVEYGLNPQSIVFEVTERNSIAAQDKFTASIEHYQEQNFEIAIDDFGSGYSGLSRIMCFSTNFIKLDIALIRDIDTDLKRQNVLRNIIDWCKKSEIKVIAEGIETEAELKTMIELGADYGQGFLLAKPASGFIDIDSKNKLLIKGINQQHVTSYQTSVFGKISSISRDKLTARPDTPSLEIFELMQHNEDITEVCVLDNENCVRGVLTRTYLIEKFSGQYGFNLSRRRTLGDLMLKDYMVVDGDMSIDEVSSIAMERPAATVYDAIIVTKGGKYLGVVTVKDLLNTAINIQVKRAADSNPLTGLPGNSAVQETIAKVAGSKGEFSIIYIDIDNFKAYNDAYGFSNGDLMIKIVADCMNECCHRNEFKGHIGGDDFVIISDYCDVEELCNSIIKMFHLSIGNLYCREDWERGYIVSTNRNGFTENFAMATLSIAAVTNKSHKYDDLNALSKVIAKTKKKCKQTSGNAVIIV